MTWLPVGGRGKMLYYVRVKREERFKALRTPRPLYRHFSQSWTRIAWVIRQEVISNCSEERQSLLLVTQGDRDKTDTDLQASSKWSRRHFCQIQSWTSAQYGNEHYSNHHHRFGTCLFFSWLSSNSLISCLDSRSTQYPRCPPSYSRCDSFPSIIWDGKAKDERSFGGYYGEEYKWISGLRPTLDS